MSLDERIKKLNADGFTLNTLNQFWGGEWRATIQDRSKFNECAVASTAVAAIDAAEQKHKDWLAKKAPPKVEAKSDAWDLLG